MKLNSELTRSMEEKNQIFEKIL